MFGQADENHSMAHDYQLQEKPVELLRVSIRQVVQSKLNYFNDIVLNQGKQNNGDTKSIGYNDKFTF